MPAFWIGIAMIAYDASGHLLAFLARNSGNLGARLWNNYSRHIYPSIANPSWYDAYWSIWFSIAIALILIGHFATRHASFSLE